MKPLRKSPALDRMFIYALVHPDTLEPFYVGRAIDPQARLKKHCRDSRVDSLQPSKRLIKRLLLKKKRPQMAILEKTTFAAVEEAERRWVKFFNTQFTGMLNVLLKEVA